MDTVILLLIFCTLWSMRSARRGRTIGLFVASLAAAVVLFVWHVTDPLKLNF